MAPGGIAQEAGGTDLLYVEYKRPGDATPPTRRSPPVVTGSRTRSIFERRPAGSWRVLIDGEGARPRQSPGKPRRLRAGRDRRELGRGVAGACNAYASTSRTSPS